ncbi:MAG: VanZ family protein [Betaproteobacteria bacterium]|nr:VanZ family protein [Betaproteobacteria bacterium]
MARRARPVRPHTPHLRAFIPLYALFIAFGSLHPYSGWDSLALWSLDFLSAPWPRFITRTDLATNLLVYAPMGYALALWFSAPGHRSRGVFFGALVAASLSLSLESLQQLLPGRIASNLDVLVNSLGGLTGALLALHHGRWIRAGHAAGRWREHWFTPGALTNLGLALLALWFLSQFSLLPTPGIGWLHLHLRPIDKPPDSLSGVNTAWLLALFLEISAVGAFTACLLRPGRYVGAMSLLLVSAFFAKLLTATVLLKLSALGGVVSLETLGAFLLAFWLLLLPSVSRRRHLAAMAGVGGLIAVRAAFSKSLLPSISALNITGLSFYLGAVWPVLALAWLALYARRERKASAPPSD